MRAASKQCLCPGQQLPRTAAATVVVLRTAAGAGQCWRVLSRPSTDRYTCTTSRHIHPPPPLLYTLLHCSVCALLPRGGHCCLVVDTDASWWTLMPRGGHALLPRGGHALLPRGGHSFQHAPPLHSPHTLHTMFNQHAPPLHSPHTLHAMFSQHAPPLHSPHTLHTMFSQHAPPLQLGLSFVIFILVLVIFVSTSFEILG